MEFCVGSDSLITIISSVNRELVYLSVTLYVELVRGSQTALILNSNCLYVLSTYQCKSTLIGTGLGPLQKRVFEHNLSTNLLSSLCEVDNVD